MKTNLSKEEKCLKTIKVIHSSEVPDNFTGIVEYPWKKEYLKNGQWHREDGPACEYAYGGHKSYYYEGKLHRIGGPVVEYAYHNGKKYYYVRGKEVSKESHDLLYVMMLLKGLL